MPSLTGFPSGLSKALADRLRLLVPMLLAARVFLKDERARSWHSVNELL